MSVEDFNQIKRKVEKTFGAKLKMLPRKKVICGSMDMDTNNKFLFLISPRSKLYPKGYGWVDITKKQSDLAADYLLTIIAFRLPDRKTYYYDFHELSKHLSEEAMIYNSREGYHWKLHIWPDRITNGHSTLVVRPGPNLVPKPSLCVSCVKDEDSNEEMLCNLNRIYRQSESDFKCGAYEPKKGN